VIDWLVRLPTLEGFLVLLAVGLLFAIGFTLAAERAFHDDARARTGASVATIVGVIAGLYAVLIAFVIVNEWQAFNNAQTQVSNESAALTTTYFNASVLPEPGRTQIQGAVLDYARSVVCVELPYLATHEGPAPATRLALQSLFTTVARAEPSAGSSDFYRATVDQLGNVSTARRARIASASSPLPDLLLVVIVVTSLALIAAVSGLDTQHRRWHIAITAALTVIVALNLALVLTLDRPFDGAAKVSDSPLREGIPAALLRCKH
jgi:Protein of unknown function (DUF4239)